MDLAALYTDLLRDIGLSATYCGLYDEAETIYKFGLKVDYSSRKPIEALAQNELIRENYSFALSEIDAWAALYPITPFLMAWKCMILYSDGRFYEAQSLTHELNRQGDRDYAEYLESVLNYLDGVA